MSIPVENNRMVHLKSTLYFSVKRDFYTVVMLHHVTSCNLA